MEVNILSNNLKTNVYGKNILLFEEIESTNKEILKDLEDDKIRKNLTEGTVYIALRQTGGIGSFGNEWQSNNSLGLWFTILLYSPYKKEPISFIPAIALAKLLKEKYNIETDLKWPNDVLVKSKKISGILCQAKQLEKDKNVCAVGIGLNILQEKKDFTKEIRDKSTSMKIETSKDYNIEEVFKLFMKYFEDTYNSGEDIVEIWKKYTKMLGKKIKAKKDGKYIEALVKDITKEGYLKVEILGKSEIWMSRSSLDIDTYF